MADLLPELLTSIEISTSEGVIYVSDPETTLQFENLYLKVREREGRIYPDSIVKGLPNVEGNHPQFQEWQIRSKSLNKLISYLNQERKLRTILDLGCGNGWIANRLAQILKCRVYAIDLNQLELEQGARVFSGTTSLRFIYGDIFDNIFLEDSFDIILMASSVQYFSDIQRLVRMLLSLLKVGGEIHIIDSPFYREESVIAARQRTIDYYRELGYKEMVDHYYHHQWIELARFQYKINYDPESNLNRFRRRVLKGTISPFPWIVIQR